MVYYLLGYLRKTCILCQIGDIAVHFTVYFDVLYDITTISF